MNKLPKNPLPFRIKGCYLAGGAILSVVTKSEVSDYDIYPKTTEAMVDLFYELEENNCFVVNVSDRAITWKCNDVVNDNGERAIIQVMTFDQFDSPKKIFDFFDFTVCMAAFDSDTEEYHFHEDFWPAVASKTLYFNPGTRYPLNSMIRIGKYTSKGYYLPKPESIKMSLSVINSGMPESWDELEKAIGGSYGRQLKLNVEDKPFSFETALEVLDDLVLDFHMEDDSDASTLKAEHLERYITDKKLLVLKIPNTGYLSYSTSSGIYPIHDDVLTAQLSYEDERALELLGVEMEEVSPDHRLHGYKRLRLLDDGSFENTINRKKLQYRVGQHTEELDSPHIHLWPEPKSGSLYGSQRDTILCEFSFKASDVVSASSQEIKVKKVLFVRADQTEIKMMETA